MTKAQAEMVVTTFLVGWWAHKMVNAGRNGASWKRVAFCAFAAGEAWGKLPRLLERVAEEAK